MNIRKWILLLMMTVLATFSAAGVALAATTVVVTPVNTQGWVEGDTRPGGEINFVTDASSPYSDGALQLTTNATNEAKAQYLHEANVSLATVTELSYSTKQVSGPTLSGIKAACPNAVALAFGVNVGTFNPSYNVETDGVTFNGTVYDFEVVNEPTSKEQCKDGGWKSLTRADGSAFKNQGDCIQYVNTGK